MGRRERELNRLLKANVVNNKFYGYRAEFLDSHGNVEKLILENLREVSELERELVSLLDDEILKVGAEGKIIRSLQPKVVGRQSDEFLKLYTQWCIFSATLGGLINYRAQAFVQSESDNPNLKGMVGIVEYVLRNYVETQPELHRRAVANGAHHKLHAQQYIAHRVYRESNECAFSKVGTFLPRKTCKKCGMIGYLELICDGLGLGDEKQLARIFKHDSLEPHWGHECG